MIPVPIQPTIFESLKRLFPTSDQRMVAAMRNLVASSRSAAATESKA
jgi:hypothetical protein